LRVYWCGAHSLMRGRACSLQLLLGFTRAVILGSGSTGLMIVFYIPRYSMVQLYPNSQGYGGGFWAASAASLSYITTDGQSASVLLVSGTHLGTTTNFFFSLMRGRLYSLYQVPVLRDWWQYFTIWNLRSPNLDDQVPIFISLRTRTAQSHHPHTGCFHCKSKAKLFYKQLSVSQFVLVSGTNLVERPIFSF
jgi:hypothetical protein